MYTCTRTRITHTHDRGRTAHSSHYNTILYSQRLRSRTYLCKVLIQPPPPAPPPPTGPSHKMKKKGGNYNVISPRETHDGLTDRWKRLPPPPPPSLSSPPETPPPAPASPAPTPVCCESVVMNEGPAGLGELCPSWSLCPAVKQTLLGPQALGARVQLDTAHRSSLPTIHIMITVRALFWWQSVLHTVWTDGDTQDSGEI